jgi:mono/diheme cytochrome c family protein
MKRSALLSAWIIATCAFAAVAFVEGLRPPPAQAIPMFAKRTGASCELCHTVFPGMTNYGMMVMMSDFSPLPYHGGGDPGFTSLIFDQQYLSNPDGSPAPPKFHTDNLGFLNGGFIGPNFTYYLEQHVVDGGFIGGTDQMWISYNQMFHGTGDLQVGKFHTPFPFMPAHRITLAPYATTSATIGANDFNEDDSHWGITLANMQGTLMYGLSALGGNDLVGKGAFALAGDHDHSFDVNLMTMSDNPLNYGVGVIFAGYAPPALPGAGFDRFDRSAVYLQYIPPGEPRLQFQAVGQLGFDSNPYGTNIAGHTRGFFTEAQYNFAHGNWGVLRWDAQSGNDSPVAGMTLDYIHQLELNLKLTVEGRELTTGPTFGMGLEWAGPWSRHDILPQPVLGSMPGMDMSGMMGAMSMGTPLTPLERSLSAGNATNGHVLFDGHNCSACHGVGGVGGGIGPRLMGIATQATPDLLYERIKYPISPMPDFKLSDAEIADLVAYVDSLTPGHTVASDLAALHGQGMSMMPGMKMSGMSMAAPPPEYLPEQSPLGAGTLGYFQGVETGDPGRGASLYASSCIECHGASGAGARAPRLDKLASSLTPSAIAWEIQQHRGSAALRLSSQDIASLTAYLETMDTTP